MLPGIFSECEGVNTSYDDSIFGKQDRIGNISKNPCELDNLNHFG